LSPGRDSLPATIRIGAPDGRGLVSDSPLVDAIVLRPGNPRDLTPEKLADLVSDLEAELEEVEVSIEIQEQRGYGVTWWEVLHVTLPWLEGYAAGKAIDVAISWARGRWMQQHEQRDRPRPIGVNIYGPNGEVPRRVKVDLPDGEAEDQ
jgi:hypothetical protein